ncbi:hypothetical protein INR49_004953 [Caranx melampygus]|nr:hypothetical protein INR49_004953 [Caranx melampygus]
MEKRRAPHVEVHPLRLLSKPRDSGAPEDPAPSHPALPLLPTSSPTSPRSPSEQSLKTTDSGQVPRRLGSVLSRLLRRDCVNGGEEREAELHLYAVSQTSRLYLHLQSSWNSFIIRSTLLLDPLYRRKCNVSSDSSPVKRRPAISWERTAHLFSQLSSELLQDDISVESLYLLLQELRTAAHRNVTLRRLFWRRSSGLQDAARLDCDPRLQTQNRGSQVDSELQALLSEYLDAACSLLFELLLLGHETSGCFSLDNLLSVGWTLRVLQPHPHLLPFISHQAQQVVLVLSELQESVLSPIQAVLLFQRCRLLLACLQYNSHLAQHLRSNFREEFRRLTHVSSLRYFVKPSCAEEKLPPHYPISLPTLRLESCKANVQLLET